MVRILILSIVLVFTGFTGVNLKAQALEKAPETQKIEVEVDGLSCPFCAYGLEKKLIKLDGVKDLKIDVENGLAILIVKKEQAPDRKTIETAVKKAGFTPREIAYPASNEKNDE